MSWGSRLRTLVAACLVGAALSAAPPPVVSGATPRTPTVQAAEYTNPIVNFPVFSNPFILKTPASPTYYGYFSGYDWFDGTQRNVPAQSTTDLATWVPHTDVMPDSHVGAWADTSSASKFTSPSVIHVPTNPTGQKYVLYFTGTQVGTGKRCVGTATSASPTGPFEGADTPLVCPADGEAMDPSAVPIHDSAGNPTHRQILFRKTGTNAGIHALVLAPDGLTIHQDWPDTWRIFAADPAYWRNGVAERPGAARIDTLLPQLFFTGVDPITGARAIGTAACAHFGIILECKTSGDGGRWMGSTDQVVSPGGVQVFRNGDTQWITYYAQSAGPCSPAAPCTGRGNMYIDKLCFGPDKEPRTNGPTAGAQPLGRNADCTADIPGQWVSTWGTAMGGTYGPNPPFANQTLRQMVHTSIGGTAIRVRIANLTETLPGGDPLTIQDASVAISVDDDGATSQIQTPTLRPLTFGGSSSIAIPPEGEVFSDAIPLTVPQDHDVAVSLFLPGPAINHGGHVLHMETSRIGPGNLVDATTINYNNPSEPGKPWQTGESHYVSGVDVLATNPRGSVIIIGDSLTDHIPEASFLDTELRWPDKLVDRLQSDGGGNVRVGVVPHAWIGSSLIPHGLDWMDERIAPRGGVNTLIVEHGANDLYGELNPDGTWKVPPRSATEIIAALKEVITEAKAAGLRVVGTTITPHAWRDTDGAPCFDADDVMTAADVQREQIRDQVNAWILTPPAGETVRFDAVADFDAAIRDPANTARPRREALTLTDCVHLSPAGLEDIADAVNLATLTP